MALDTIVNVTVTRDTRAPTQAGFGTPLLVAYHTAWADRARAYTDPDDMLDDGFANSDAAYKMATTLKAQNPSVERFVVGRRSRAFTQVIHWIPRNVTVGFVHSLTINGTAYTYTVDTDDDVADIVAGMATATSGAADVTTAGAGTPVTHMTITADDAGELHSVSTKRGADLFDATADPDLEDDLDDIRAETDASQSLSWYGILIDSNSAAEIAVAAAWAESRTAQVFVQSADWDIKDATETDDVASTMQTASYARSAGLYHDQVGTYAAAAMMSLHLTFQPGIATMAHKTLAGVPSVNLTGGEKAAIEAKNWSHYTDVGTQGNLFEGKTPAGEFVDIVRDIDFSTARIQETVFGTLAGVPKVPYTDGGAEQIRAAVLSVLRLCSSPDHPIFDPESIVVTVPKVLDVPSADRANRVLPNVTYEARLQGAIHKVRVRGSVFV
jgi:hypothetical protein